MTAMEMSSTGITAMVRYTGTSNQPIHPRVKTKHAPTSAIGNTGSPTLVEN